MIKSSIAKFRSTRLSRLLLGCAAVLVVLQPIRAQESPAPRRAPSGASARERALRLMLEQAIERRKDLESMEPMPALVGRNTLDKGAIAAVVHANRKTPEEMDRPHIPEGFLLKQVQEDPDRQVDAETQNAYYARMVRTRGRDQSPGEAHHVLHGTRSDSTTVESAPPPGAAAESPSAPRYTIAVVTGVVFLVGFLLLFSAYRSRSRATA